MEIGKFIMELVAPKIVKGQMLERVDELSDELLNNTLPPFKLATDNKIFNGPTPFKATPLRVFNRRFQNDTGTRDNFINSITLILSNVSQGLPLIKAEINKLFKNETVIRDALNYQQATLLRLISLIDFALNYSRRLYIYTLGEETPLAAKVDMKRPFNKAEVKWIEEHSGNYCKLMKVLSKPMKTTMEIIQSMPDVIYDPASEAAVASTVGIGKLDPLRLQFIPIISDTIMFFGKTWYELSGKKILKAQEELNDMQNRLELYKNALNGEHDASDEKLIEITEERISEMEFDLKLAREKAGVSV